MPLSLMDYCFIVMAASAVITGIATVAEKVKAILFKRWIQKTTNELLDAGKGGAAVGALVAVAVKSLMSKGPKQGAHTDPRNDKNGQDDLGGGIGQGV